MLSHDASLEEKEASGSGSRSSGSEQRKEETSMPRWAILAIAGALVTILIIVLVVCLGGGSSASDRPALKDGQMTIGYWNMMGRSDAVHQVLAAGIAKHGHKIAYKVDPALVNTLTSWHKPEATDSTPYVSTRFAAPLLVDESTKVTISQTTAILNYLGEKYSMEPEGFVNKCLAKQYIADQQDLFGKLTKPAYIQMAKIQADEAATAGPAVTQACDEMTAKDGKTLELMKTIEAQIKGPYYFGKEPTYVDYALLGVMDSCIDLHEETANKRSLGWTPKMLSIYNNLRTTPAFATTEKTTPLKWDPAFGLKILAENVRNL